VTVGVFAAATAVKPTGADTWESEIQPGWDIGGNANGGYLLAIAARALVAATGRSDPVSVTAHYLSPGTPGPVVIGTEVVRAGRRFTTAQARLFAGGRPLLTALGTFGDLDEEVDQQLADGIPPDLPPPDECVLVGASGSFAPPFMGQLELRVHPDDIGFATGRRSGIPKVTGWFRLHDDEPLDTIVLLCALDAFPPAIFNTDLPVGWVPTIELTTHVRARPAPGWLRCRFVTRYVTGGFLEEDGEIWDERGHLVAQSRQLALVPRG
jgi:acyl-coenzyme A thioesterase PaaI-like protein